MVTRALLLLVLAALAAPAAGQREVRDAVDAMTRGWRDGVTTERFAALQDLARFDDPACVDGLLELFARGEVAFYPAARRVLGGYTRPDTQDRIVSRGLKHKSPVVREQVLLALGEGRPAGLDWRGVARGALDDADARARASAVHALGRARDEERLDRLLALATDPSERVRLEVPEALARIAGVRTLPTLKGLLEDDRWRVRLAAARALADLREPEAIAPLVERLGLEQGRLREDILALLRRQTGKDFGMNVEAWRKFLREAPADFLRQGDTVALYPPEAPRYETSGFHYYDISSASRRFVLLTDLSGSMETPLPELARPDQAIPTRLSVAQTQLLRLIDSLGEDEAFDLLTFRDEGQVWRGHTSRANDSTKKAARREVESWKADGATNIYASLAAAFDMADRVLDGSGVADDDIDSLFLLSDGAPSTGVVRDAKLLLEYAAERNRTLQLRMHCISLAGEAECRDFLRKLAALGNGQYVELAPH